MPRNDAFVGVVTTLTLRLTLNFHVKARELEFQCRMQVGSRILIMFVGCLMTSDDFPFSCPKVKLSTQFPNTKNEPVKCIYLFGFERKKRAAVVRETKTTTADEIACDMEKWRRHLFSQLRKKRNFFSLFLRRCIPHHNFCSLLAMTRCEKKTNNGWHLWNVFEHFKLFIFSR